MGFSQPTTIAVNANTTSRVILQRQASYPLWGDFLAGSLGWTATYSCGMSMGGTYGSVSPAGSVLAANSATTTVTANVPGFVSATPYQAPLLAVDQGTGSTPYVYIPAGFKAMFTVASGAALPTAGFDIALDQWSNPGETVPAFAVGGAIIAGNWGGSSANYGPFTTSVWIRPRTLTLEGVTALPEASWTMTIAVGNGTFSYTNGPNAGLLTLNPVANVTTLLPLVYPSEFVNSVLPWASTRLTAASLLATNVTQVLNKAGTVLAGRVSPQVNNIYNVTSSYIAGLHPAEKAWLPLEMGLYTYCPPSTDLVDFWDYTLHTDAGPNFPLVRLDNTSLANVAFMTAGGQDESLALTASWHIEFRTSSSLFPIALSGMPLETLHSAQLTLAAAGFFFHNPDHKSVLSKIMTAVATVAPAIHPLLGMIANAGKEYFSRDVPVKTAKMAVPTTTAQASGIIPSLSSRRKKKVKVLVPVKKNSSQKKTVLKKK